ncbi:hypothetical protein SFRURICE_005459 [Spodoptera frugiperda]|nr:hypothetical protein SFRURICE_005459 [Spodoptera frugiperda]
MEAARKLLIKRRNVEYVLQYSNVTPFMWHKGKYKCFYCNETTKDPEILRQHTAEVHQFANLELVVFDRTKNNRNKDAAVKIDVTGISCKLCPQAVTSLEELIHHLIIAHDAEYDVSVPNCLLPFKLDKDQPTCPTCDMKFVFFEYLLRHANKNHLSHHYICDVCGTSFQGENHLKMHYRYYHREGGYTCEYCGISLATLSKKILHEKNVHLVNLSTCPHCPETFKSPYLKKLHLANVHGVEELKIKCPYCPKVYPQESIMSRHMRRVHLREKNVECEVCGDKFFGPYDVKLHMVKHNGEKRFVCSVCGKKFSKRSNLNSHAVLHTREKDHICMVCNKAFAHQTNLRMHIRNRHSQYDQSETNAKRIHNVLTSFSERTQDNYIDRLCRKRRNVLQILHYGNVIPFNWHTKGFRCFYCSKPMRDCETLKEHTTKHIVDLPSFIAKSIISKDIPVKLDVSNLSCKLCIGTPIQNLEELISHIVEVHEEEYDRTLGVCAFPFVLTKDIMQCVLCKNMYDNFTCMVGHMYKDHINHSFICQICGYSFITKIRLKRHINNSHVGFRCSVCGKMFNAAHRLIKHKEKIHGQANTRECNLCSATFESQYLLKVHLGKMHNVEKYRIKCEYCPKVCSTKGAMILHVQSQHSESKFECDLCNYKTGIKWLITLHKKKHFGDRDYACSICEKMFRRSSNLRSHMKVHSGTSGRVCRLCRRGFVDLDTLNAHKREQKKGRQGTTANDLSSEDYDQAITTSSVDTKQPTAKDKRNIMRNNVIQVLTKSTVMPFRWLKSSYRCFYCYDIFQEPSELKRHQETHVGDEIKIQAMKNYWESVVYVDVSNLSCSLCPEIVTDLNNLIDHLITSHNVDYNKDAGVCMVAFKLDNFNVSCLACGANFYTFGPLLHHTNKDHKGTSAILCDICGQNFKDASLLRLHVKSVHENAIYLCTECGEKFDSKSKLRTHQKNSHDVEKKYKCADCSEVFHSMYKRSQHMAAEHKNRPQIRCPHCPKTFVFRSMMMTHLRDSHLKFRNHVCGVCGWKAFNSNRLKNHMYKHSGEKNFKCDACDKAFTTKKIMRAHFARMHKNPQPMLQIVCGGETQRSAHNYSNEHHSEFHHSTF